MSLKDFIERCHTNLLENKTEQEVLVAKEYLTKRNLLEKSIISTRIGYCNSDWKLPDSVRFFGEEERDNDGSKNGYADYISSHFNGRIVVPVYSEFNKIVGIATRKPLSEKGNTWWNLPSPFKKGEHLFLLNISKKNIFDKNKVYLVEGYMDAIILQQYGLNNVVAVMGTALTSKKIGLIARYCNNVCICFDMDANESGQKARDMSIAILKKFDFCENISVINGLPIGEDPDTYVAKNGLDVFLEKEVVLKDSDIEKICRRLSKQKNYKEVMQAK